MTLLRLPVVAALFALLAGVLPGLRFGGPAGILAAAAVLAAAAALTRERWSRSLGLDAPSAGGLLLLSLALAGAALGGGARTAAASDCRANFADGAELVVRGRLAAGRVVSGDPGARLPMLPVDVAEVRAGGRVVPGCTGTLRVRLPRETPALRAGTELEVRGEWWTMAPPVVPSGWPDDPARAGFVMGRAAEVRAAPSATASPRLWLRGAAEARLVRLFPRHAPLVDALLLGRRETLDGEVRDRFARAGLVHLLAISGTHVGMIGAAIVLLCRAGRLGRGATAAVATALVAGYLVVIGAPPSAVRAGLMLTLALAGTALQRPTAPLAFVAAAAFAILVASPAAALDLGFQLSFAGVLGILLLRGAMLRRLPDALRRGRARPVTEALVVSAAAFLTTMPLTASYFGQVAPVAIVANLPAVPLAGLALTGAAAALVLDPVVPPLARLVADGAGVALDVLDHVVSLAEAVPGGHVAVARPQWPLWLAAAVAFLLALDAAARMRGRVRWTVALGSACAALLLLPAVARPTGGGLEIAFLDVGQGDAVALRTPAGRWLLVDAGERDDRWDAGERRVLPFLHARGASRLEALVLTHPHADHVGGAAAVLRGMEVGRVVDPGHPAGSPVFLEALRAAEAAGVPWEVARSGRSLEVDGVTLEVLWPDASALDRVDDANDISVVVRVRYGAFAALLTGDAPAEVEHLLAGRHGAALRADVVKAGHHGSRTSTSDAWLDAARPGLVVISAGRRNRFGHPHAEVTERIARHGVAVARTDRDGTVVVAVEEGGEAWSLRGASSASVPIP